MERLSALAEELNCGVIAADLSQDGACQKVGTFRVALPLLAVVVLLTRPVFGRWYRLPWRISRG